MSRNFVFSLSKNPYSVKFIIEWKISAISDVFYYVDGWVWSILYIYMLSFSCFLKKVFRKVTITWLDMSYIFPYFTYLLLHIYIFKFCLIMTMCYIHTHTQRDTQYHGYTQYHFMPFPHLECRNLHCEGSHVHCGVQDLLLANVVEDWS